MTTYTHILDLAKEAEPPADGILSRPIFQDNRIEAVAFGFGQPMKLGETPPPPTNAEIEKLLAVAPKYGVEIRVPGH